MQIRLLTHAQVYMLEDSRRGISPHILILGCATPMQIPTKDLTSKLLYKQQEQQKRRKYVIRVIEVEQGTFTLLVSSTTGGIGEEFIRYHCRLAELLATEKIETYSTTISWIRARVSFALLSGALSTRVEKCPCGLRAGLKKVLMCGL